MYNQTDAQVQAEKRLNKQGFKFSNWISAQTDDETQGTMVLTKKPNRATTEYREIEPDGSVN
jgi:hypothetical protein